MEVGPNLYMILNQITYIEILVITVLLIIGYWGVGGRKK